MNKKILIIGLVWPEPKSSASGSRMLQLIEQFQNQGYSITFVSAAKPSKNTFNLASLGIRTQTILLNDSSFDVFISKLKPDAVMFDRFMTEEYYGWRVTKQCPSALRILDTEDFHGLRKAREVALKQCKSVSKTHLHNAITKREIASIFRCDLSLIISEVELELLVKQFKIDKNLVYYLPFLIEPVSEERICQLPNFKERQHFITIGNFLHAPNYDAVLYLKQSIWPLIRKTLPKAELHIYGAYESQKVTQLHDEKEGFLIKGFTKNANEVMQNAKICLAPIRFGAGLKGKLIDAMQNGTPCIMTTIASEGMFNTKKQSLNMNVEHSLNIVEVNGFVEDAIKAFAIKAVELYTKKKDWQSKQIMGFKVLNQRFNKVNFEKNFASKISELIQNIETHRQANFMGQLLQHQTLQATKYMSKWIEEKNKTIAIPNRK